MLPDIPRGYKKLRKKKAEAHVNRLAEAKIHTERLSSGIVQLDFI